MRQSVWVVLLATALAAGCVGGDDSQDPTSPAATTSATATDTATGSATTGSTTSTGPPPTENRAPTASLDASVEEAEVPFNVTFAIDGSDPDGDELGWELDTTGDGAADETGASLPAERTVTYDAVGTYNVTLWVSDGNETASQSRTILALPGAPTTCGGLGRLVAEDAEADTAGAAEALCLGASYDGAEFSFHVWVEDPTSLPDTGEQYFDFYFTPDFGEMAGDEQLVEATWDGEAVTAFWSLGTATGVEYLTYRGHPVKEVTAAWEGNVLTASFDVANLYDPTTEDGAPADGDRFGGVYVDINHCEGDLGCEIVTDDRVPDDGGRDIVFAGDDVAPAA